MKLYISENIDKSIQGYVIIPIVYGEFDLTKIPDNSATEIVAIDAIDSIKYDKIKTFISTIITKMRIGCNLYLGGTDIYAVSRHIIDGTNSLEAINTELLNKTGAYSLKFILELLKDSGVRINSATFKGDNYEISAIRPKN